MYCASARDESQLVCRSLEGFVATLARTLDERLDKRLVRTFILALKAILTFRHTKYGLLLSELGAYVLSAEKAPAGTKRLSNLLRSPKWGHQLIEDFLWHHARDQVQALIEEGVPALLVWDESVLEKPESQVLEGLGPVRSSKAARLKRIKPGYFNPPGGRPVFVPGMQWLCLMVCGLAGAPTLAAMRWWTSRGPLASAKRSQEAALLKQCAQEWGRQAVHVWDRGFASSAWLGCAFQEEARFIVRWQSKHHLVDEKGQRNTWKITRGKRSQDYRMVWDFNRRCYRKTGILVAPVKHPEHDHPLWLVVSRQGQGRRPWYLLTNEPINSLEDAWRIVFSYARRWQVEMAYRYSKAELAMESPRLWRWENRLKLLLLVSLVYAFLLSLVTDAQRPLVESLLRHWCHRTGKRYRQAAIPLYRLRSALSRLWLTYPPELPLTPLNSG